jgi:uncharacterized protein
MITGDKKTVIGMVHIGALPGTPSFGSSVAQLTEIAVGEAILLSEAGFDAVMLENMHDVPYLNRKVGPEIIAAMTAVSYAVRQAVSLPIGIQVLAGANMAALAIALACELDFIRAEAYIFSQISDEGFMTGDAAELLRYRRRIGAEKIKIFCDIKKKHASHAITNDIDIARMAEAAEFFLADGVIVTGSSTGKEADKVELQNVRQAVSSLLWVGSGLTESNISEYWNLADGFIIGSSLKEKAKWQNPLSPKRCQKFMDTINRLRNNL